MMMTSNYASVPNNWKPFGVPQDTVLTSTPGLGAGNDLLALKNKAGVFADLGLGNDILKLTNVYNSSLHLGAGNDTLTATNLQHSAVTGGIGDDTLTITGSFNVLEGGIHSSLGSPAVRDLSFGLLPGDVDTPLPVPGAYTGDNDTLRVTGHSNLLNGQGGDDRLFATGNDNILMGGYGSDNITVKGNHNFIVTGNLTESASNGLVRDYVTVTGNNNVLLADSGDILRVTGSNNFVELNEGSAIKGALYATHSVGGAGNFLFLGDAHTDFSFSVANTSKLDLVIHDADLPNSAFTVVGQFAKSGLLGVDAIYTADGYTLDAAGIQQAANGVDVSGLWHVSDIPMPTAIIPTF